MAVSLRAIMSEQAVRKVQEDSDERLARRTKLEEDEFESAIAAALAASLVDAAPSPAESEPVPRDAPLPAADSEDVKAEDAAPAPAPPAAEVDPGERRTPRTLCRPAADRAPPPADLALAMALQAEEDRVFAVAAARRAVPTFTSSRCDEDPNARSRLRQDELFRAEREVAEAVLLRPPRASKGSQRHAGGIMKHDAVLCGQQNARYLERVRLCVCMCVRSPSPAPPPHSPRCTADRRSTLRTRWGACPRHRRLTTPPSTRCAPFC